MIKKTHSFFSFKTIYLDASVGYLGGKSMTLKNLKEGFAIILCSQYKKYFQNTFAIRVIDNEEEAKYNASSMTNCDKVRYMVFDCKNRKILY